MSKRLGAIKNPPKVGDIIITTEEIGAVESIHALLPEHVRDALPKGTRLRVTAEDVEIIDAETLDGEHAVIFIDGGFRVISPLEQLAEAADG